MTEFDKVIRPGGTGKVEAKIHTTNFKGPVSKSVTVTLNDPAQSKVMLTIKADIKVPIDVTPSETASFSGKASELKPFEAIVTSPDKTMFDILAAKSTDTSFTVAVKSAPETGTPVKTKAGQVASGSSRYAVTVTPSTDLAVGPLRGGEIILTTSHPKQPEVKIRVFGNITGDIEVAPPRATLMSAQSATPEQKVTNVTLRKTKGGLKIASVASDNADIKATLTTVTEGSEYRVEIKYAGKPLTTMTPAKVTVKTNDPRQGTIEIPVVMRVDATQPIRVGQPGAIPPVVDPHAGHNHP